MPEYVDIPSGVQFLLTNVEKNQMAIPLARKCAIRGGGGRGDVETRDIPERNVTDYLWETRRISEDSKEVILKTFQRPSAVLVAYPSEGGGETGPIVQTVSRENEIYGRGKVACARWKFIKYENGFGCVVEPGLNLADEFLS